MELLRRRVGKIWRACNSLSRKNSTSHMFWLVKTCPKLFTPVYNCSHLFPPVHTCSQLFTTVHTCSHLSDILRCSRNGSFSLNFPLVKAVIFRSYVQDPCYPADVWCAILLKLHVFAHLIESYPTLHGLSSCIEIIMSIPQEAAHTTVTMYACRKMSFFALSKALILQSYVVSC